MMLFMTLNATYDELSASFALGLDLFITVTS